MTASLFPPTVTPPPRSMTESSGWNFRLAFLKGSLMRITRSTPGSWDSFSPSRRLVSPSAPRMVVSLPLDTMTFTPPASMARMASSICSAVKSGFKMITIYSILSRSGTPSRRGKRKTRRPKTDRRGMCSG